MNDKRLAVTVSNVLGHIDYKLEQVERRIEEASAHKAGMVYYSELTAIRRELEELWNYFTDDPDELTFDLNEEKS